MPDTLSKKAKHIGIIACSAEGAALCYTTICSEAAELMGVHNHPEISMHTPPLAEYMKCIDQEDWHGVAKLMRLSSEKLAQVGAEFAICPDNTIHQSLKFDCGHWPIPLLHIAEAVIDGAKQHGYLKLGLTGTKWLVKSEMYPDILDNNGIECVRPSDSQQDKMNNIIMDELVAGRFDNQSIQYFIDVISGFKEQGCDAVILGCTEIPLIINPNNSPLPVLDSTRLLARAALKKATL